MSLTPELLLHGYSIGVFPMAEHRNDTDVFWVDPKKRGIFPLDGFHASRSLRKTMRKVDWTCKLSDDFSAVVEACADRAETWINDDIFAMYAELHKLGHAHSFELWEEGALIGGVYGVTLGRAFFGESMFSRRTDASKVALVCLIDHLKQAGFELFDTQFLTEHLQSLGAIEISRAAYHDLLDLALIGPTAQFDTGTPSTIQDVLQRITQTS
jgi:leucyl/phenylalanyl-tRNA--protein transferase